MQQRAARAPETGTRYMVVTAAGLSLWWLPPEWSDEANGFARSRMNDIHAELLSVELSWWLCSSDTLLQHARPNLTLPNWNGLCEQLVGSLYMESLSLCVQLDAKCTLMTHAKRHSELQATVFCLLDTLHLASGIQLRVLG